MRNLKVICFYSVNFTIKNHNLREKICKKINEISNDIQMTDKCLDHLNDILTVTVTFTKGGCSWRVDRVTLPKIVINLPLTFEKLHCKGEPYQFSG